ncbi:isocitrate lyase/phosphoenolpyruvate mutase family protein [Streptomyces sp. NPDC058239]|uniref:isocitrate lyase/phosphoenolpyruvate mutase family protein n=1 Tax=unclassified Streptomyces TaxID=2593676 RepID=UPI00365748B8
MFVNARVDTYRLPRDRTAWIKETLVRAHAYAMAGADGDLRPRGPGRGDRQNAMHRPTGRA